MKEPDIVGCFNPLEESYPLIVEQYLADDPLDSRLTTSHLASTIMMDLSRQPC